MNLLHHFYSTIRVGPSFAPPPLGSDPLSLLEKIVRAGFAMTKNCLNGTKGKIGLLFFTDDFVARGGLCAVQSCGLSVPKNLQIVTFTNKGYSPVFPVELTRLEADPFRMAQLTADEVLRRLADSPPQSVIGEVGYIPGSTLTSGGISTATRKKR